MTNIYSVKIEEEPLNPDLRMVVVRDLDDRTVHVAARNRTAGRADEIRMIVRDAFLTGYVEACKQLSIEAEKAMTVRVDGVTGR